MTSFRPVTTVRAYERIVSQIEEAIRSGELSVGDRLPSERDMMTMFEVSRSTVREALRVLQSNGIVRLRPGDPLGPEIIPISATTLERPLTRLLTSNIARPVEVLQFRIVLESATSELAAAFRTEDQLRDMSAALEALRASVPSGREAWSRADLEFHASITRAAGNQLFVTCCGAVRTVAQAMVAERVTAPGAGVELSQWFEWHSTLFDAIKAGDVDAAGRQARLDLYRGNASLMSEDERRVLRVLVDPTGQTFEQVGLDPS